MATPASTTDRTTPSGARLAQANGVELAYEEFGERGAPPVVLVMGLGTQRVAWPDELVQDLVARGHHVIRYDNRDCGESTVLHGVRAPAVAQVAARRRKPPYTVSDMGRDLLGLLDALDLPAAHLVGASMGGFISQSAAVQAPERVRSAVLIMTSTGNRRVGRSELRLLPSLLVRRQVRDREEAAERAVATFRVIGSPGFPFDEERIREIGRTSYDRGVSVGGFKRQLAAVVAQSDRTERLRRLDLPATVVHGLADPLVSPTGGLALARALRGSRFVGVEGMGHDLPRALWPELAELVASTVARGEERAAG